LSKTIANIASITDKPPRIVPAIVALSPTVRPPEPDPESDELGVASGEEEVGVADGLFGDAFDDTVAARVFADE
jgi:hypothetical protein